MSIDRLPVRSLEASGVGSNPAGVPPMESGRVIGRTKQVEVIIGVGPGNRIAKGGVGLVAYDCPARSAVTATHERDPVGGAHMVERGDVQAGWPNFALGRLAAGAHPESG